MAGYAAVSNGGKVRSSDRTRAHLAAQRRSAAWAERQREKRQAAERPSATKGRR